MAGGSFWTVWTSPACGGPGSRPLGPLRQARSHALSCAAFLGTNANAGPMGGIRLQPNALWPPWRTAQVLPPLSVGKMTLRLYGALNYSQNSARDLRPSLRDKWSVNAFFAKGCVHITNSKQRKHHFRRSHRSQSRGCQHFLEFPDQRDCLEHGAAAVKCWRLPRNPFAC